MTNPNLHTIKIEGLPEGWIAVEVRLDPLTPCYIGNDGNLYRNTKVRLELIKTRMNIDEAKNILKSKCNNEYHKYIDSTLAGDFACHMAEIIVTEKIKLREITLVETDEERQVCQGEWYRDCDGNFMRWMGVEPSMADTTIWKIKEK